MKQVLSEKVSDAEWCNIVFTVCLKYVKMMSQTEL